MDLLTQAQRDLIENAIHDVTDTFMKTPVSVYKISAVADIYNEDRTKVKATTFEVRALVEYSIITDEMVESLEGSNDYNAAKLTLNNNDMIAMGMVVPVGDGTYNHVLTTEQDYFRLKEKLYRITDIVFDGPLSEKEVLLVIQGVLSQTRLTIIP